MSKIHHIKLSPTTHMDVWYDRTRWLWYGQVYDKWGRQILREAVADVSKDNVIAWTAISWHRTVSK